MCLIQSEVSRSRYDVLIVEKNKDIRQRIRAVIEADSELLIWGEAVSLNQADKLLTYGLPALALVDIDLPERQGETLINGIREHAPVVRTIALTMFNDDDKVNAAVKLGACGYLLKNEHAQNISLAIKQVLKGRPTIFPSNSFHKQIINGPHTPDSTFESKSGIATDKPNLTPTEQNILKYIAKGFSGPEIAELTDRSVNTVRGHIKSIYRKLSASGRGEAVYRALQQGIIGHE